MFSPSIVIEDDRPTDTTPGTWLQALRDLVERPGELLVVNDEILRNGDSERLHLFRTREAGMRPRA